MSRKTAALTESRARAREVDALVDQIAEQMVSGEWVTGRSHAELAKREGVSVSQVENWAAQAARLLRVLASTDKEDLRARNQARFDLVFAEAMRDGAHSAAVSALAEQGRLLGLNAPEKVETTTKSVASEYEALSPPQRVAWLREQARALLVEAEAIEQDMRDAAALPAEALPSE